MRLSCKSAIFPFNKFEEKGQITVTSKLIDVETPGRDVFGHDAAIQLESTVEQW